MSRVAVAPAPPVTVPKLWQNATIACLATGPSLTQADVDAVRGKVHGVIAVNDAFRLAPWADVLFACDARWWSWHWTKGASEFPGLKYALMGEPHKFPSEVQILRRSGTEGLELDPTRLRAGYNSGYQAINLAVHLGAVRILLLGYDMKGTHFFGNHPDGSLPPFPECLGVFPTLVEPLRQAGVSVVNCTRSTALTCFPRQPLNEVLS